MSIARPYERTVGFPPLGPWLAEGLARRLVLALDLCRDTIVSAATHRRGGSGLLDAVVAESALLLRLAAPAASQHPSVDAAIERLAVIIERHGRTDALIGTLCLDAETALEHASAHVQLTAMGRPDLAVDRVLAAVAVPQLDAEAPGLDAASELERRWLRTLWSGGSSHPVDRELLARTRLGRPLDTLAASHRAASELPHAVLHATDAGRWIVDLPRAATAVQEEAEALLAVALDAGDLLLATELLWCWPMLRLGWTSTAAFAFAVVADTQDRYGFVPGPGFDRATHRARSVTEAAAYVQATSWRATLAMGVLCAAALSSGWAPPLVVLEREADDCEAGWRPAYARLDREEQRALSTLVLTTCLRRARAAADIVALRDLLQAAARAGCVDGAAARDALAVLRRTSAVLNLAGARR